VADLGVEDGLVYGGSDVGAGGPSADVVEPMAEFGVTGDGGCDMGEGVEAWFGGVTAM
jgi:hypothetical protein